MAKTITCSICGRSNSSSNTFCSNCGARLNPVGKSQETRTYTKIPKKSDFDKLIESVGKQKEPPKNIIDLLKPNDTKLFLFVNIFFASAFMIFLVKNQILFSIIFYPVLYYFSCYWATRSNFDWKDFLIEFFTILLIFFVIFSFI